jgi:hypothetical protein
VTWVTPAALRGIRLSLIPGAGAKRRARVLVTLRYSHILTELLLALAHQHG